MIWCVLKGDISLKQIIMGLCTFALDICLQEEKCFLLFFYAKWPEMNAETQNLNFGRQAFCWWKCRFLHKHHTPLAQTFCVHDDLRGQSTRPDQNPAWSEMQFQVGVSWGAADKGPQLSPDKHLQATAPENETRSPTTPHFTRCDSFSPHFLSTSLHTPCS